MTDPKPAARHVLRERTEAAHERLHHLPDFAALAAGELTRDGYLSLLGRLYGFHAPMEAVLEASLGDERGALAPEGWRRADLLIRDLSHFGASTRDIENLPVVAVRAPESRATAIGCLYVLEGSTLGGRVLARGLDGLLPVGSMDGRRFLRGGTAPNHARWAAVCAEIDDCGETELNMDEMIAGAHECFATFDLWFRNDVAKLA